MNSKGSKNAKVDAAQSQFARLTSVLSEIFCLKNVVESFQVAFKKRDGGIRHVVVLLIFLFSMYMLVGMGIGVVSYPYVRETFVWESSDYFVQWWSTYSAVSVGYIK